MNYKNAVDVSYWMNLYGPTDSIVIYNWTVSRNSLIVHFVASNFHSISVWWRKEMKCNFVRFNCLVLLLEIVTDVKMFVIYFLYIYLHVFLFCVPFLSHSMLMCTPCVLDWVIFTSPSPFQHLFLIILNLNMNFVLFCSIDRLFVCLFVCLYFVFTIQFYLLI